MDFRDTKDVEKIGNDIGIAAISQLSSIRALSKMGLPLDGIIALKKLVDEIDCMLWSLVPMGMEEKHANHFTIQCEGVKEAVDTFISAAQGMAELCKTLKS